MAHNFEYDLIKSEAVIDFMKKAEKQRYSYFRLLLTPERMVYYDKYSNKFPLKLGIVIYWDSKGNIRQTLFNKDNSDMSFQCAGYQEDSMVFSMDTPKVHLERELIGGGTESLLIILKTGTSTIFIGYDSDEEQLNVTYCIENGWQPSVAGLLQKALDLPRKR